MTALALDRNLLTELSANRNIALVSGTNGKTTTTCMLTQAWRVSGHKVVSNSSGANLPAGHVLPLASRDADSAVLEVDERYLPAVATDVRPRLVVLLNLTRDQLDRVTEVRRVAERWRLAAARLSGATIVLANADDPLVAWAASAAPAAVWVAGGHRWVADSAVCPSCGEILELDEGHWGCPGCLTRRPDPQYTLDGTQLVLPSGQRLDVSLRLPGRVNVANAAFAVAAADQLGVPPHEAAAAVARITTVSGRYALVRVADRRLQLFLAKNPAGWLETLDLLQQGRGPVIVGINARAADGRDTSWLWDVPFERLRGRPVIATGDRRTDLAVRLAYAGAGVCVADTFRAAVRDCTSVGQLIPCAANYTAFHDLLRDLNAA